MSIASITLVEKYVFVRLSDGRCDYKLSYTTKQERKSGWGYSDRWGRVARQGRHSRYLRMPDSGAAGKGSLGSWRRQDKAARPLPFRSVSTPRSSKYLGDASHPAPRCIAEVASAGRISADSLRHLRRKVAA